MVDVPGVLGVLTTLERLPVTKEQLEVSSMLLQPEQICPKIWHKYYSRWTKIFYFYKCIYSTWNYDYTDSDLMINLWYYR